MGIVCLLLVSGLAARLQAAEAPVRLAVLSSDAPGVVTAQAAGGAEVMPVGHRYRAYYRPNYAYRPYYGPYRGPAYGVYGYRPYYRGFYRPYYGYYRGPGLYFAW
jgi:hypothetical protein